MATRDLAIRISVLDGDKTRREFTLTGEEGQKALEKIREATKPASQELVTLNAASEQLFDKFRELGGEAGNLGGFLTRLGPAGIAAAAALGGLLLVMKDSVEEAEKFNQAQRKLDAVLQATGEAAGQSKEKLTELAEAYAHTTLFTAEQVQQSEAVLLTYKRIHSEVFDQALQATLDISTLFDKDLTASARAVGRALEDPENGMKALQRVGVQLDPVMKETIKNLMETGQQAAAQKLVLDALAHSVGGQAAAQDQGVTGAAHNFSESLKEVKIALGENIEDSGVLEGALNRLAKAFQGLRAEIRPTAEEELKELNARMQLLQNAGNDTLLFGLVDNPAYTGMAARKKALQDQLAAQDKANEEAKQNEKIAIAKEHAEALLQLDENLAKKIKEQTQTEQEKIIEETAVFRQKINAELLPDKSNQADVDKELALVDKLQQAKFDKLNEKEAQAAEKLAEANQKVVDGLRQRVALEAIADERTKFVQGEANKLNPSASSAQVEQTKKLAAALFDEQKAARDAKTAEEAHAKAVQTINQEILKTKPSFEAAKQALDEWKKKLIDDLGSATAENEKYLAEIDQIYSVKLKEIYKKSQQDSKDWQAGAARGLAEYSQEAQNAAKDAQSFVTTVAKGIEDTLVDIVSTGKINMQKIGDMVKSLEQDILRSFIRQNITGPIAGQLSGLLGGGADGAGGGAGGGIFGSLFSSIFHDGGVVGSGSARQREVPSWLFAAAPRLHTGLAADEFPAILQRGETVIPRNGKAGSPNIVMNINTPNVQSFMESQGQVMAKLATQMNRYHVRNN